MLAAGQRALGSPRKLSGRTLLLDVLPLAWSRALGDRLAEQRHEFTHAVPRQYRPALCCLVSCLPAASKARVAGQVPLGAQFHRRLLLVLQYLPMPSAL